MCGIVGVCAKRAIKTILLDGLGRLEYRGYDSAGILTVSQSSGFSLYKSAGKIKKLRQMLADVRLKGTTGIAHTRWATHGEPNKLNAHPHASNDEIAIVHNGIIENHEEIKARLIRLGYEILTDTDSEVAAHLIHYYYQQTRDILQATSQAISEFKGAYALGVACKHEPDRLLAVRIGSPLVVGFGNDASYFASDLLALLPYSSEYVVLEDGDIADVTCNSVTFYDKFLKKVKRELFKQNISLESTDRGNYKHYMQKEIFEQPHAVIKTITDRVSKDRVYEDSFSTDISKYVESTRAIHIVACGTSYHAGMVAKYWFEKYARIPVSVEIASEYRYRQPVIISGTLLVVISQSGETADTLAVVREAKKSGYIGILCICNVVASAMARESDIVCNTLAGPEIGVASTKAFTTQLCILLMLVAVFARKNNQVANIEAQIVENISRLPLLIEQTLTLDSNIRLLSEQFVDMQHTLFLGRGSLYPIALEGALKLKELSYINASGYAAGELKHGPLALVDKSLPVVILATNDALLHKLKSNMQEVQSRGGKNILFTNVQQTSFSSMNSYILNVPPCPEILAPIIFTLPLQLLSYYTGVLKGTDVDQPRNLAKSVTVE